MGKLSEASKVRVCESCGVTGKYYAKGKCGSCYTAARLAANPDAAARYKKTSKSRALQQNYGITLDDYDRMFAAQGGRCAICLTDQPGASTFGRLAVDHCHVTHQIRGLLCSNCNLGLGHFHDDDTKLMNAFTYIRKFRP